MAKHKRKMSKSAKRRLMVFGTISIAVMIYFVVSCSYYVFKIHKLNEEVKNLRQEYTDMQENEEELKTDIDKLQDPDYLARYARENYHYTKEDELVIQRTEKEEKAKSKENKKIKIDTNLVIYISGGLLAIIVLYVLIRKK